MQNAQGQLYTLKAALADLTGQPTPTPPSSTSTTAPVVINPGSLKLSQATIANLLGAMHTEAYTWSLYSSFASLASQRNHPVVASAFNSIAKAEFWNSYMQNARLSGFISNNPINTTFAIGAEGLAFSEYASWGTIAKEKNQPDVAHTLFSNGLDELNHRILDEQALSALTSGNNNSGGNNSGGNSNSSGNNSGGNSNSSGNNSGGNSNSSGNNSGGNSNSSGNNSGLTLSQLTQSVGQAFEQANYAIVQAFESAGHGSPSLVPTINHSFQKLSSRVVSTLGAGSGQSKALTRIQRQVSRVQTHLNRVAQRLNHSGRSSLIPRELNRVHRMLSRTQQRAIRLITVSASSGGSSSGQMARQVAQAFDTASSTVGHAFQTSGNGSGSTLLVSSIDQAIQQLSSSIGSTLSGTTAQELALTFIDSRIANEQYLLDEMAQNLMSSGQGSQNSLDATLARQSLRNAKLQALYELGLAQNGNNGNQNG